MWDRRQWRWRVEQEKAGGGTRVSSTTEGLVQSMSPSVITEVRDNRIESWVLRINHYATEITSLT